ncbi:hypothetical protein PIB30_062760 [Stylosanthes scabra]|uniref:Uncharacterized protein n=1 Tax=Stylosanthes scabra TaxID=79078 RepID=A0ABU6ULT1_9FABA|nr:hypothetical protein [Stylosanthes scabra]
MRSLSLYKMVTGSSPLFHCQRVRLGFPRQLTWGMERTQKGSTGRFGMGSGIIYYKYEKHEKFEYYDRKADVELGTLMIRRYHFDDESFVHALHSVRFNPDRPYKVHIEALMADRPLSSFENGKSSTRRSHPSRRSSPTPHYSPRGLSSTQRELSTSR